MRPPAAPRVLLLCDRLDLAGGVERFVCQLAHDLDAAGMAVSVGSVATPRPALHYPVPAAVPVLHAAARLPTGGGAWGLLRKQWATGQALARLVRAQRPEVVVLNGLTTACSALMFLQATAPGLLRRCIVCDHNHFGARSRLWQGLRAWLYPRVGAVVSLTQADAGRFAALNPRTRVIANASALWADAGPPGGGHPASGLAAPPNAEDVRPAGRPLVVLAVGRHVAQKGLDLLLQAWAGVCQRMSGAPGPAPVLQLLGDGPLTAGLQAQAQALGLGDQVRWLPPTAQVRQVYAQADLFVLPSRYEGMPLALLEAQAMGLPAVAFDCPTGPAEILGQAPEAPTGVLVPAGDVQALAEALHTVLADAGLRQRMGQAARERSRARFSPEQHRAGWQAVVREVAAEAANR